MRPRQLNPEDCVGTPSTAAVCHAMYRSVLYSCVVWLCLVQTLTRHEELRTRTAAAAALMRGPAAVTSAMTTTPMTPG